MCESSSARAPIRDVERGGERSMTQQLGIYCYIYTVMIEVRGREINPLRHKIETQLTMALEMAASLCLFLCPRASSYRCLCLCSSSAAAYPFDAHANFVSAVSVAVAVSVGLCSLQRSNVPGVASSAALSCPIAHAHMHSAPAHGFLFRITSTKQKAMMRA